MIWHWRDFLGHASGFCDLLCAGLLARRFLLRSRFLCDRLRSCWLSGRCCSLQFFRCEVVHIEQGGDLPEIINPCEVKGIRMNGKSKFIASKAVEAAGTSAA